MLRGAASQSPRHELRITTGASSPEPATAGRARCADRADSPVAEAVDRARAVVLGRGDDGLQIGAFSPLLAAIRVGVVHNLLRLADCRLFDVGAVHDAGDGNGGGSRWERREVGWGRRARRRQRSRPIDRSGSRSGGHGAAVAATAAKEGRGWRILRVCTRGR